jgi:hypothetical protein
VVGALPLGLQMVSGFESAPTLFVEVYLAFFHAAERARGPRRSLVESHRVFRDVAF